ncbi:methyltransferase domain protein [Bacteriovorax sp. Seq25_V]|uniref:methyltransferase domain protein n=1 Tax=Bacteriovorax sp. Seq25_V TaxID=1201288 RepID=UPI00038A1B8E|nr:methyltransferase domain protein [Bacteriovorax sp. Seq25_V]EQC47568.1 methyltransferase domain protein [Bacteriovorax sp. Seq25_V]
MNLILKILRNHHYNPSTFSPAELADLYTKSALLVTVMGFIKEQLWLQQRDDKECGSETSYRDFITPLFKNELSSVLFLKDFLIESGEDSIKDITKHSQQIEQSILLEIPNLSINDQKIFLVESLDEMSAYFIQEEEKQQGQLQSDGHVGPRLYRTFDRLDEIFDLNYNLDFNMKIDHHAKERLYQNAGVGVQSGYSTILLALHNTSPKIGATMIDLGSGYGRVGLVCSLIRPDVNFIGYEYVPHRVDVATNACEALDLQESLAFEVQDLSVESFDIPEADIYYLYDPFTEDTYHYVLEQIVEFSKHKKITVVTKGNANTWLRSIAEENNWPAAQVIDEGNLCIFTSV